VKVACVASECGPFNPSARPFGPFDQTNFDCMAQDHLACVSCMLVKFGLERSQCQAGWPRIYPILSHFCTTYS
jgi:hypothetical protein